MQKNSSAAYARLSGDGIEWGIVYHRYHNIWRITRAIHLPSGNSNVDTFGEYPTETAARAEADRLGAKN